MAITSAHSQDGSWLGVGIFFGSLKTLLPAVQTSGGNFLSD